MRKSVTRSVRDTGRLVILPGLAVEAKVLGEVGRQAGSRRGAARFAGEVVGGASLQLLTQAQGSRSNGPCEGVVTAEDVPSPPAGGGHWAVQGRQW